MRSPTEEELAELVELRRAMDGYMQMQMYENSMNANVSPEQAVKNDLNRQKLHEDVERTRNAYYRRLSEVTEDEETRKQRSDEEWMKAQYYAQSQLGSGIRNY